MYISQTGTKSGDFTSDGLNVLATVTYVGAPLSPDPASIYNGTHCGSAVLGSDACSPNNTHVYPLFLDDGTAAGMGLGEMRLHPDNKHVTWNSFTESSSGALGEINGVARLSFNATGLRYDLINVTVVSNPYLPQPLSSTSHACHVALINTLF